MPRTASSGVSANRWGAPEPAHAILAVHADGGGGATDEIFAFLEIAGEFDEANGNVFGAIRGVGEIVAPLRDFRLRSRGFAFQEFLRDGGHAKGEIAGIGAGVGDRNDVGAGIHPAAGRGDGLNGGANQIHLVRAVEPGEEGGGLGFDAGACEDGGGQRPDLCHHRPGPGFGDTLKSTSAEIGVVSHDARGDGSGFVGGMPLAHAYQPRGRKKNFVCGCGKLADLVLKPIHAEAGLAVGGDDDALRRAGHHDDGAAFQENASLQIGLLSRQHGG